MDKQKIIIAVTGASGLIYAKMLIDKLQQIKEQLEGAAVVFSEHGKEVWKYELGEASMNLIPFIQYQHTDFFVPFASGSSDYQTMIICPCSMGTLGRIANGTSDNLIIRSADVMLKERRKLILVIRESPYNLIHINNMKVLTLAGAIICPASPSFYSFPQSLEELTATVVDRVLELAGFKINMPRWNQKT
jgi:4-hydroxy-3-polyprenylbenzoate decarboxylase